MFPGIKSIYKEEGAAKIASAHVVVIGLGGVGSWAVESLARTGVGKITLIDLDEVCASNINRQICATTDTIGKSKAIVLKERILSINKNCDVDVVLDFFTASNAEAILVPLEKKENVVVIDAIDSIESKCTLISKCYEKSIPFVVIGGAAGKIDPLKITVSDLGKTINDHLLKRVRKKLRREFGFSRLTHSSHATPKAIGIAAVYSSELTFDQSDDSNEMELNNCDWGAGSVAHVTGVMGLIAASVAINKIVS